MGKYRNRLIRNTVFNIVAAFVAVAFFELSLYITYRVILKRGVVFSAFHPIAIFFFILLGLYCYSQFRTKKIKKSVSDYYSIIEGLTDEYDIIFLIDIDEDKIELLKAPKDMAEMFAKVKGKTAKAIRSIFFDNYVSEESKEYALPFMQYETIIKELEK
ncbi:MAG: hypothetical protein J5626_01580, partial [Lachnospiraceae bacterium]|nr:hypothetical protein [Lachnospiraceae bacterium]